MSKKNKIKNLVEEFLLIAKEGNELPENLSSKINDLFKKGIEDIWFDYEGAKSYFIFLMNGLENQEELKLAKEILVWSEFNSKEGSQVRCLGASEKDLHDFCLNKFEIKNLPCLIISDSIDFENSITISKNLISKISTKDNGFKNFVHSIHGLLIRNIKLEKIEKELSKKSFWDGVGLVYKEVKGFLSISIKPE